MTTALMTTVVLDMTIEPWRSINDGVMGGRSSGGMFEVADGLQFRGELSLENNGGFSSVRRMVKEDLAGAERVRFEVRGDGREYQFRIRQNSRFDGVAWRAQFSTNGEWQTFEMSLSDFIPVFRGVVVRDAGRVVASDIQQIGFLLADKEAGAFELDVRHIEFLGPDKETSL